MEGGDSLTVIQISRLADWLLANGHSPEEIIQCIKYIAGEKQNEKGSAHSKDLTP